MPDNGIVHGHNNFDNIYNSLKDNEQIEGSTLMG